MAQPYLGERRLYSLPVPAAIDIDDVAHQAGYSKVSRFGADAFCDLGGRPDLKLGPDVPLPLNALPLPLVRRPRLTKGTRACSVRVPDAVDVDALARRAGYRSAARYGADVFCDLAGRPDLKLGPDAVEGGQPFDMTA